MIEEEKVIDENENISVKTSIDIIESRSELKISNDNHTDHIEEKIVAIEDLIAKRRAEIKYTIENNAKFSIITETTDFDYSE